jgi:hypothetical protein
MWAAESHRLRVINFSNYSCTTTGVPQVAQVFYMLWSVVRTPFAFAGGFLD